MRRSTWVTPLVCGLILLSSPALACMWDYDTLRDERRGLPGIAEVLAGRWEKHSRFFYQHRVETMKALIAREPSNLAAYDNLAVAYEKLDDRDAAIDVMRRKEAIKPGEYTTYANLGTFYLHKGDLENGITYIRKALYINPAAHFGREEYQLKAAEFYRDAKADPGLLNRSNFLFYKTPIVVGRAPYPLPSVSAATRPTTARAPGDTGDSEEAQEIDAMDAYRGWPGRLKELGLKDNVFDGIVGMIRFGTGTSAELYLTLGDLLMLRGDKNLAYRAYRRSADLGHPRQEYLASAMKALDGTIYDKADIAAEKIAAERAAAEAWVSAYQQYEDGLIRAGQDTDDEANYAAFYEAHGAAREPVSFALADLVPPGPSRRAAIILIGLSGTGALAILLTISNSLRRRQKRTVRRP